MDFAEFFQHCRNETTVSDFESYLSYCIFRNKTAKDEYTLEMYSYIRDRAFEKRDEQAARVLYDLASAADWKEGDWEGALR